MTAPYEPVMGWGFQPRAQTQHGEPTRIFAQILLCTLSSVLLVTVRLITYIYVYFITK
jgi:hypothetical protein